MPFLLIAVAGVIVVALLYSSRAEGSDTVSDSNDVLPPSNAPAGIRNNNPTNLKGSGWQGATGKDRQGHNIFDTMVNGLRAAFIDINTKMTRGDDSVDDIVQLWAGAEAPNIQAYKQFVAKRMGVNVQQKLTYQVHATPLIQALSAFENAPYDVSKLPYADARKKANKG